MSPVASGRTLSCGAAARFGCFYSTMQKSRNRYMLMKTKDRCHFYSTMIGGYATPERPRHHMNFTGDHR
jgi:hypothetical protein